MSEQDFDIEDELLNQLKNMNGQYAVSLAIKINAPVTKTILALEELHQKNLIFKNYNDNKWYMVE